MATFAFVSLVPRTALTADEQYIQVKGMSEYREDR
jgi:hypothetical protein